MVIRARIETALAYHPDKRLLASSSYDQTVKVWNLDTGKEVVTLVGHAKGVNHVAFSPKGDRLASASQDRTVRVWDYERYRANEPDAGVQIFKGHLKSATSVAFHPDGQLLASGSQDRSIKVWNLTTEHLEKNLTGHEGEVVSLTFGDHGKSLISAGGSSQRGEVLFWDFDLGKIRVTRNGLSDRILSVTMSREGKVAAAGADGMLRIWNHIVSSEALSFRADPQTVPGVAFAPDGLSLASAGQSGRVSLWNSSAGSETLTLSTPGSMEAVAFNPTWPFVASAGTPRGEVRVWNLDQPEQPIILPGHKGSVFCLSFSPDGRYLASGGEDHAVRIVDFLNRDKEPALLQGHTAAVNALAYRPDGRLLASAGEDESIRLHDPATGELLQTLTGHTNGIRCLAFSPDGQWLASGSYDKTIRLWNVHDLNNVQSHKLEGHTGSVNAIAFNGAAKLDDLQLASASSDKSIRVWDVRKRIERFKLEGSPGKVQSLAFHPGGRRLVSVGQDRMIRLWDIVTRQEILEFEEHLGTLRCVAFSTDGRSLAGAGNGVVRVWQASKEMLEMQK